MIFNAYCHVCGSALELRPCEGESTEIPYCVKCGEYRFAAFNVAVCTALFNSDYSKLLMMRQYGREKYNFLAGYITQGEDAETALKREMLEEMGMYPEKIEYLYSAYFQKSNTLMLNFLTTVKTESLEQASKSEVDDAQWFNSFEQAYEAVIKGSLAERLLKYVAPRFAR
ncbi:MAG: NUDIX domain-containing protein [Bacteroidia bacterium]|nr:NUDIX domain-containing protein [Bacteroidia bacterium]